MNSRERFYATMHYQPRDRCPIMDFGFWRETLVIWKDYGLPQNVFSESSGYLKEGAGETLDSNDFFGMEFCGGVPVNTGLCPDFGRTLLEDRGDSEIVKGHDGVTIELGKFLGSIPRHIDHTLKDRASWEKEFSWRLNGKTPTRIPGDWKDQVKKLTDPNRDYPLQMGVGSLYGWVRDWMGVENLSVLVYDDRPLFEEMVEKITDCILECSKTVFEAGIRPESAAFWEDMCYRAGPLLSPKVFKEVLAPNYKRLTSFFKKYGLDVVIVDCDGDITLLAPLWLEAGVNTMFPIEVGAWEADPVQFRKQFGRDMLMMGGVGKRILASSPVEITREVERLAPLVEEGGYIPTPDHRVPPDVPLKNYLHYLKEARRIWGKGLPNLKSMGKLNSKAPRANETYLWDLKCV